VSGADVRRSEGGGADREPVRPGPALLVQGRHGGNNGRGRLQQGENHGTRGAVAEVHGHGVRLQHKLLLRRR